MLPMLLMHASPEEQHKSTALAAGLSGEWENSTAHAAGLSGKWEKNKRTAVLELGFER